MPRGAIPFPFGSCKVCQAPATGNHYGANTCEGCKGFFKRSLGKSDKYKCLTNGNCSIDPENRIKCKLCRFKRCINFGMSMDAIKMGRIPKVQKQMALENEKVLINNNDDKVTAFNDIQNKYRSPERQSSPVSSNDDCIEPPSCKAMKTSETGNLGSPTGMHSDVSVTSLPQKHNNRLKRHNSAPERQKLMDGYHQQDNFMGAHLPSSMSKHADHHSHPPMQEENHDMVQLLRDVITINDQTEDMDIGKSSARVETYARTLASVASTSLEVNHTDYNDWYGAAHSNHKMDHHRLRMDMAGGHQQQYTSIPSHTSSPSMVQSGDIERRNQQGANNLALFTHQTSVDSVMPHHHVTKDVRHSYHTERLLPSSSQALDARVQSVYNEPLAQLNTRQNHDLNSVNMHDTLPLGDNMQQLVDLQDEHAMQLYLQNTSGGGILSDAGDMSNPTYQRSHKTSPSAISHAGQSSPSSYHSASSSSPNDVHGKADAVQYYSTGNTGVSMTSTTIPESYAYQQASPPLQQQRQQQHHQVTPANSCHTMMTADSAPSPHHTFQQNHHYDSYNSHSSKDFVPTSEYNSLNETIPVSPYAHIHEMVDSQLTTNITQIYWDVTSDVREGVHVMEKILATGSKDRMLPFSHENLPTIWKWLMESVAFYNEQIAKFCMTIPLMSHVCADDKAILIKHSYISLWLIWNAPLFKNGQTYIPFCNTYVYTRDWMEKILPSHFVEYLHEYAQRQNSARFSISEISLLCGLALTPANVAGIKHPEIVREVHEKFRSALVFEVNRTRLNPQEMLNEVPYLLKHLEIAVEKQEIILSFDEQNPPPLEGG